MRHLITVSLILAGWMYPAYAAEVLREISWTKLRDAGQLAAGRVAEGQPPAPGEVLTIGDEPQFLGKPINVLTLDSPGIKASRYAITGQICYEDVEGQGYLEMWSYFPDGSHYFTRTEASRGPMKRLEGNSGWRDFSLPFIINEGSARPSRLLVNVVLPGRGTVHLGPLHLVEYADDEDPLGVPGQWWDEQSGGWIGGISGSVLGCLGGLIGLLSGLGRARRLVLGLAGAICLVGVLILAAGVTALALGQPYGVWYPLVLLGGLCTAVMGGMLPVLWRRYQQIELRRMAAMDAAAGQGEPR